MWFGHISEVELARRAGGNSYIADNNLAMGTADITTVAVAEAVATANTNNFALTHICDRPIVQQCARGFRVGYNMGATFGSTFLVYQNSLPDSLGHPRQIYG